MMMISSIDLVNDNEANGWWSWIASRKRSYLISIVIIVIIAFTSKVNKKCGFEKIIGIAVAQNWEKKTQPCLYNAKDCSGLCA